MLFIITLFNLLHKEYRIVGDKACLVPGSQERQGSLAEKSKSTPPDAEVSMCAFRMID